jgi:hypothetical protein
MDVMRRIETSTKWPTQNLSKNYFAVFTLVVQGRAYKKNRRELWLVDLGSFQPPKHLEATFPRSAIVAH